MEGYVKDTIKEFSDLMDNLRNQRDKLGQELDQAKEEGRVTLVIERELEMVNEHIQFTVPGMVEKIFEEIYASEQKAVYAKIEKTYEPQLRHMGLTVKRAD